MLVSVLFSILSPLRNLNDYFSCCAADPDDERKPELELQLTDVYYFAA